MKISWDGHKIHTHSEMTLRITVLVRQRSSFSFFNVTSRGFKCFHLTGFDSIFMTQTRLEIFFFSSQQVFPYIPDFIWQEMFVLVFWRLSKFKRWLQDWAGVICIHKCIGYLTASDTAELHRRQSWQQLEHYHFWWAFCRLLVLLALSLCPTPLAFTVCPSNVWTV